MEVLMALLIDDLPDQTCVSRLTTVQAKQVLNRQPKKAKQFLHRAFASIEDLADSSGASEILMDMREELIGSGAFSAEMLDRMEAAASASPSAGASIEAPVVICIPGMQLQGDWSLNLDVDCLIVDGDLSVDGRLEIAHYLDDGSVIVLGTLTAHNMTCEGWLVVCGDLAVHHMHACSGNDCAMLIAGNLSARSVVETGQEIFVAGNVFADVIAMFQNELTVEGKMQCLQYAPSWRTPSLTTWFDYGMMEECVFEDDDGSTVLAPYPSDDYVGRLLAGASPLRVNPL